MIYAILKISVRLALKCYCAGILIHDKKTLRQQGPLLFASNHPNSFLDALIIAANTKRKTHILVRGDVFARKQVDFLLRYTGCLPIYRRRDGRSMLGQNGHTFEECVRIFGRGDNLLIFSEGNCENEWKLRPLGNGTARLAFLAWGSKTPADALKVIPTGFTYSHFNGPGKRVIILTGDSLYPGQFDTGDPKRLHVFNHTLKEQLISLILQFPGAPPQTRAVGRLLENIRPPGKRVDKACLRQLQQELNAPGKKEPPVISQKPAYLSKRILFALPAAAGWLLHAPLYYPLKAFVRSRTKNTVYYDSVLFGALFFLYPFYLVLLTALPVILTKNKWGALMIILAPFLAFLTVKTGALKKQG